MTSKKTLTVAVLSGGNSAEREVSLKTGAAVARAAKKSGYKVLKFDPAKDLPRLFRDRKKIDVVFPALHGRGGEDGVIQGLLDDLGLPYVGSGARASARAFDKISAKEMYRRAGLPVARDFVARKNNPDNEKEIAKKVGFPCFVKPIDEGSSYGASPVQKKSELAGALRRAFKFNNFAIVEEFLKGIEITVGVLQFGRKIQALPIVEIVPKTKFFDFKAKYDPKFSEEIVPARISKSLTEKAQQLAVAAHECLGCRHISRTDMMVDGNKITLLETNTLPGMTDNSLVPKEAAAAGTSFESLVDQLLRAALKN